MNLSAFHRNLLGKDPEVTPKAFQVSDQQRLLYEAFPKLRGYATKGGEARSFERFVATLVCAMAQTDRGSTSKVVQIITPRHQKEWVLEQTERVVRYAARSRRKDALGQRILKQVFDQINITWSFPLNFEPPYWVAFGFTLEGDLPPWIESRLLSV